MKNIKLMPDYECFPLWHHGEGEVGNIDPALIGISDELVDKLNEWQYEYDSTLNKTEGQNSGFTSKEKEISFVVRGFELAKALKAELNGVNVVYYDIDQQRMRNIT